MDARETWLPVVGYEGKYEVSDLGRVRSVTRVDTLGRKWSGKMLRLMVNSRGYRKVTLNAEGRAILRPVHTLVCEAFNGAKPQPDSEVRHLDGDRLNNHAGNLMWGTCAENAADTISHGRHANTRKDTCPRGHILAGDNLSQTLSARRCRSCYNALMYVRRHPDANLAAEADKRYEQIAGGWDRSRSR